MKRNIRLENWEKETENLKDYFIARYFDTPVDVYWVNSEIGGVLVINDYFFSLQDIVDYIKYDYSKKKMFERYDYVLRCMEDNRVIINIKHYKKLKKITT